MAANPVLRRVVLSADSRMKLLDASEPGAELGLALPALHHTEWRLAELRPRQCALARQLLVPPLHVLVPLVDVLLQLLLLNLDE